MKVCGLNILTDLQLKQATADVIEQVKIAESLAEQNRCQELIRDLRLKLNPNMALVFETLDTVAQLLRTTFNYQPSVDKR